MIVSILIVAALVMTALTALLALAIWAWSREREEGVPHPHRTPDSRLATGDSRSTPAEDTPW